jgi:hypothetical protein
MRFTIRTANFRAKQDYSLSVRERTIMRLSSWFAVFERLSVGQAVVAL